MLTGGIGCFAGVPWVVWCMWCFRMSMSYPIYVTPDLRLRQRGLCPLSVEVNFAIKAGRIPGVWFRVHCFVCFLFNTPELVGVSWDGLWLPKIVDEWQICVSYSWLPFGGWMNKIYFLKISMFRSGVRGSSKQLQISSTCNTRILVSSLNYILPHF